MIVRCYLCHLSQTVMSDGAARRKGWRKPRPLGFYVCPYCAGNKERPVVKTRFMEYERSE